MKQLLIMLSVSFGVDIPQDRATSVICYGFDYDLLYIDVPFL